MKDKRVFIHAAVLFGLILYPIVRADSFYIDDLGRSLTGYLAWGNAGRPLADFLTRLFYLGKPLTDITPWPQIIAVGLFAWLAVGMHRRFDLRGDYVAPLVALPLIGSPLFLENLSYKFDIVSMSLAVCLAGAVALHRPVGIARAALGAAALLVVLCLYQPALNVFLVWALLALVVDQLDGVPLRRLLKRGGARLVQLAAASALYALVLHFFPVKGDYASAHAGLASAASALPVAGRNFLQAGEYAWNMLWNPAGALLIAAILLGVAGSVAIALRYAARHWRQHGAMGRLLMAVCVVALPAGLLAATQGPMLLLESPVIAPRTQIGIGALATAGALMVALVMARWGMPGKWTIGFLAVSAYPLLVFSCAYGNALSKQKEYEAVIAHDLADDFSNLAAQGVARFTLKGNAGKAPVVMNSLRKYPILGALAPTYLTEGWRWAGVRLRQAGVRLPYVAAAGLSEADTGASCDAAAVIRRNAYQVCVVGDMAVVSFRSQ